MDDPRSDQLSATPQSRQSSSTTRAELGERVLLPIVVGVLHGLMARAMFGSNSMKGFFEVMTLSFIVVVPFSMGLATVALAERRGPIDWWLRVSLPVVVSLIALFASLALAWEGLICVVLWVPLYLFLSILGGLVAVLIANIRRSRRTRGTALGGLVLAPYLLAPYLLAPLELRVPLPNDERVVENEILIRAPLERVWANVARVPAFREDEHRFAWSHLIGFPRPVEATLSHEGVGGVRHATFERGVLFIETITAWEEQRKLTFSIHADATTIPPTTLDEHVSVGGPFFDVLEGEYELEPLPDGVVRLHLRSRHRVSTHFNVYATLWTDWIMSDVQSYILDIVRRRCEAPS